MNYHENYFLYSKTLRNGKNFSNKKLIRKSIFDKISRINENVYDNNKSIERKSKEKESN